MSDKYTARGGIFLRPALRSIAPSAEPASPGGVRKRRAAPAAQRPSRTSGGQRALDRHDGPRSRGRRRPGNGTGHGGRIIVLDTAVREMDPGRRARPARRAPRERPVVIIDEEAAARAGHGARASRERPDRASRGGWKHGGPSRTRRGRLKVRALHGPASSPADKLRFEQESQGRPRRPAGPDDDLQLLRPRPGRVGRADPDALSGPGFRARRPRTGRYRGGSSGSAAAGRRRPRRGTRRTRTGRRGWSGPAVSGPGPGARRSGGLLRCRFRRGACPWFAGQDIPRPSGPVNPGGGSGPPCKPRTAHLSSWLKIWDMKSCAVLFSGGLDSTTALAWALGRYDRVTALTFDYGQRHRVEVAMARRTARRLGDPSRHPPGRPARSVGGSASDGPIPCPSPVPRVRGGRAPAPPRPTSPFRNGVFLALAAAWAEARGIRDLVCGVPHRRFPRLPRHEAGIRPGHGKGHQRRDAGPLTAGRGCASSRPSSGWTKADIVRQGPGPRRRLCVRAVSCYAGREVPCRACSSCRLRARAWKEAGREDPLLTRLRKEKKR
jgi:7-cyano-7-deazaguanine synthase